MYTVLMRKACPGRHMRLVLMLTATSKEEPFSKLSLTLTTRGGAQIFHTAGDAFKDSSGKDWLSLKNKTNVGGGALKVWQASNKSDLLPEGVSLVNCGRAGDRQTPRGLYLWDVIDLHRRGGWCILKGGHTVAREVLHDGQSDRQEGRPCGGPCVVQLNAHDEALRIAASRGAR